MTAPRNANRRPADQFRAADHEAHRRRNAGNDPIAFVAKYATAAVAILAIGAFAFGVSALVWAPLVRAIAAELGVPR